jgi:hypothetical protein
MLDQLMQLTSFVSARTVAHMMLTKMQSSLQHTPITFARSYCSSPIHTSVLNGYLVQYANPYNIISTPQSGSIFFRCLGWFWISSHVPIPFFY